MFDLNTSGLRLTKINYDSDDSQPHTISLFVRCCQIVIETHHQFEERKKKQIRRPIVYDYSNSLIWFIAIHRHRRHSDRSSMQAQIRKTTRKLTFVRREIFSFFFARSAFRSDWVLITVKSNQHIDFSRSNFRRKRFIFVTFCTVFFSSDK